MERDKAFDTETLKTEIQIIKEDFFSLKNDTKIFIEMYPYSITDKKT